MPPTPHSEVIRASDVGVCGGVQRALAIVQRTLAAHAVAGRPVFALGQPIHNDLVCDELAARGLRIVAHPSAVPDGAVVVQSAHGTPDAWRDDLLRRGCSLVDTACPHLQPAAAAARRARRDGAPLLIYGDPAHPEVMALRDDPPPADWPTLATVSVDDAAAFLAAQSAAGTLLIQSSRSPAEVGRFLDSLRQAVGPETWTRCAAHDTICQPVRQRHEALEALARSVDLLLVAGGRRSSNTRRLAERAAELTRCHMVGGPEDLDAAWFAGVGSIGVAGGTSTPADVVGAVAAAVERMVAARRRSEKGTAQEG